MPSSVYFFSLPINNSLSINNSNVQTTFSSTISTITTTSVTSTTTVTTTTTTTTTTTPNPCGTPTSIGTSSAIYSTSSGSSSYTCQYSSWTASNTGSVNLVFNFRNDPDEWHMDDVSVWNGTNEMLLNGGFESGNFSPGWTTSTPNGACSIGTQGTQIDTSSCRTGRYCLSDGCGGRTDQISQSFSVTAGKVYYISFWLKQGGTAFPPFSLISVSVMIS